MCLIAWRWQPGTATPLLLLANRDEFYARPTAPLRWWPGGRVLAGQDLQAGGTWLGLGAGGRRLAALTNFRDPGLLPSAAAAGAAAPPSRGALVSDFLQDESLSAADYLAQLAPRAADFQGFNLLLFDGQQLLGFEGRASRGQRSVVLEPGLGAVSNAGFDTPWPKLLTLKSALAQRLAEDHEEPGGDEALLALLRDPRIAPDESLPATGVPQEWERALSAIFIATPNYGTRASALLRLRQQGGFDFLERSFDASGVIGMREFKVAA